MALTTRVWSAGKLLVLLGALLATYFLFAAAAMRVALRAREVAVPDLAGRTVNEASELLANLDLQLRVEEGRRVDPKVPADQILQQDPPANSSTRRQRSVRVWVSAGQRLTAIPAVVGESEQTAQLRFQRDSVRLAAIAEIRSADYPGDVIVGQEPTSSGSGDRVSLLINRGERRLTYVMPDLIGVSSANASEVLRARGFRVAVVADFAYPDVPPGVIIRQHPNAGFQIAPGEPISLEVSR